MFTANFSATQSDDCESLTITDSSDYSSEDKSTFTSRKLWLYKADGSTIKFPSDSATDYIDFNYTDFSSGMIVIAGVDKDYCLRIKIEMTSGTPQPESTYLKEQVSGLVCYTKKFDYNISCAVAVNPNKTKDQDYYNSWSELRTELDAAERGAEYSDQNASQQALNRAKKIMDESKLRF